MAWHQSDVLFSQINRVDDGQLFLSLKALPLHQYLLLVAMDEDDVPELVDVSKLGDLGSLQRSQPPVKKVPITIVTGAGQPRKLIAAFWFQRH